MSLINDALKRAKQAQEEKTPPSLQGAPLHTVPTPPRQQSNQPVMLLLAGMLFIVLVGIAILIFMRSGSSRPQPPAASAPVTAAHVAPAVSTPAPTAPVAPVAPVAARPAPAPVVAKPAEPVAAMPTPAIPTAQPVVQAPPLQMTPSVKLQGVLFSPTRPAAIINGRTLFIGDHVGDVRVIAISQESATVVWNGQTNELTMER